MHLRPLSSPAALARAHAEFVQNDRMVSMLNRARRHADAATFSLNQYFDWGPSEMVRSICGGAPLCWCSGTRLPDVLARMSHTSESCEAVDCLQRILCRQRLGKAPTTFTPHLPPRWPNRCPRLLTGARRVPLGL